MAVTIPQPLFPPTTLTTSTTTLYTAPSGPTSLVVRNVRMRFANNTANPISVTGYAVPSGGSPVTTNVCIPTVAIAGNSNLDIDMPALAPGGSYAAASTTTATTALIATELAAVIFS